MLRYENKIKYLVIGAMVLLWVLVAIKLLTEDDWTRYW